MNGVTSFLSIILHCCCGHKAVIIAIVVKHASRLHQNMKVAICTGGQEVLRNVKILVYDHNMEAAMCTGGWGILWNVKILLHDVSFAPQKIGFLCVLPPNLQLDRPMIDAFLLSLLNTRVKLHSVLTPHSVLELLVYLITCPI
jgi:hypothetical protein